MGRIGPDISIVIAGKTWDELVGDLWNHTPRMIDEMGQRGYGWPSLSPQDMADTFSYLYYLRLFSEPGNPARGAEVFGRFECAACHGLGGHGGTIGVPLDRFGRFPSAVPLASAMWNAGPRMQQEQLRRGGLVLRFTGREMTDLQAYIRSEGRRRGRDVELQSLPNPGRGATVYQSKQCGVCHDRPQAGTPDVFRTAFARTASETTSQLWNHSYAMSDTLASRGAPVSPFADGELSDLIAYLYSRGYEGRAGDSARGAAVFNAKGCVDCHAPGKQGPDLAAALKDSGRFGLASAMWNHAEEMRRVMGDEARVWPKFEPGQMRDLIAYLQGVASGRGTPPASRSPGR